MPGSHLRLIRGGLPEEDPNATYLVGLEIRNDAIAGLAKGLGVASLDIDGNSPLAQIFPPEYVVDAREANGRAKTLEETAEDLRDVYSMLLGNGRDPSRTPNAWAGKIENIRFPSGTSHNSHEKPGLVVVSTKVPLHNQVLDVIRKLHGSDTGYERHLGKIILPYDRKAFLPDGVRSLLLGKIQRIQFGHCVVGTLEASQYALRKELLNN